MVQILKYLGISKWYDFDRHSLSEIGAKVLNVLAVICNEDEGIGRLSQNLFSKMTCSSTFNAV